MGFRQRKTLGYELFILLLALFAAGLSGRTVPSPKEVLGFEVGADYHLASYQQALAYFRLLEKSSARLKLVELGKTSLDKPMICAVITSEKNMAELDRFKSAARRLAQAKGMSDDQARQLAREAKAVVYIDGGLHAAECAPAQHNIQLAYDLLAGEDADTRLILDNVILLLVFANPDGMDMLAEWYLPLIGMPFETSPLPRLYHRYAGHDNNRDSFMNNLLETQNITRLVSRDWNPQIVFNQHQTAPFPARIWVPPHAEPFNPNMHPLMIRWQNLLGTAMAVRFDSEGKSGVISRTVFDSWFPGYVTHSVDSRNMISILTETALYRYATPRYYTLDDFPEGTKDMMMGAFYTTPWKGGWWRLRDAVEYCQTASMALLQTAALYKEKLLFDRYQMGRDVIRRFKKEAPYAWIIPQEQWDPGVAPKLLNNMILMGVEVSQALQEFTAGGITYPAGTWVIPLDQAFGLYIKSLFEVQKYPELSNYPFLWQGLSRPQKFGDAYLPPYDVAGWTLPLQMNVKVLTADAPLEVPLRQVDKAEAPAGKVAPKAGVFYAISPRPNSSFTAVNRILKKGGKVMRAGRPFKASEEDFPAGTWIIPAARADKALLDSVARELSLEIGGSGEGIPAGAFAVAAQRIGLYQSWTAGIDEGWTRWLLEQYEFPFTTLHDADIKAGDLQKKFDILIIPSMDAGEIIDGYKKGRVPPAYEGGLGVDGVARIRDFIEAGGTMIVLNEASTFAIEAFKLPVADSLRDNETENRGGADVKFVCPGSLLRMKFNPVHPVAYGMPDEAAAVFVDSRAFAVVPDFKGDRPPAVIAGYADSNLLMSGYLKGESYLAGRASALDVPLGRGRVILLGFGVQTRAQPHGTFKLLFNSLFLGALQPQ